MTCRGPALASDEAAASSAPAGATRLARLSPLLAWLTAAAIAALIALGCVQGANLPGARGGPPGNDSGLFLRAVDHLRAGESYYAAVTREHREMAYPLRPVVTVRLPTLAWAMAALPDRFWRGLSVQALAAASFAAWLWRLRGRASSPVSFGLGVLALGAAHAPAFIHFGYTIHELWAGLLISLSLAVYRPDRWWPSLLAALLALSIRELAAPYLLAMAALALRDGRRGEAAAWLGGLLALALALTVHAAALGPFVRATDVASAGWLGLNGWRFVLLQMKWNLLLMTTPDWAAAILAPLALLGLLGARGALADRLLLVVGGYTAAFLVVGRADNSYWGLLTAPLWPLGLFTLADTARDLLRASRRRWAVA
jgi:hypothetical protein